MMKICVLIPSYNESRTIGRIVSDLKSRRLPVYVVDDGSKDDTAREARDAGAVVIVNEKNMGKGFALRTGFDRIVKEDYEAVLIMDGDGQHDISDIDKFFGEMERADAGIVIGNRMSDTARMPLDRNLTNKAMSYVISRMCGQEIPDTQCGYKLIKIKVLKGIKLESSNFEIESEILVKAARAGYRISSIPVKTVYGTETSKIKPIFDTFRFFAFLIRMTGR